MALKWPGGLITKTKVTLVDLLKSNGAASGGDLDSTALQC